MIEGMVTAAHEAVVPLSLQAPEVRTEDIKALVDTGYSGFLLVEQGPAHVVRHQALPVLGEDRGVEAALHQVHVQEPAVEQAVLKLLAEGALTAHRVRGNQQRGLQQPLGRDGGPTHTRIHAVELR